LANSHGKGSVDGIGSDVKRKVWLANLAGELVSNAESFVQVTKQYCMEIEVLAVTSADIDKDKPEVDEPSESLCSWGCHVLNS